MAPVANAGLLYGPAVAMMMYNSDDVSCSDGQSAPSATNEAQANLRDNVESFGNGMKIKDDKVTLKDEKVTSPIAGKITDKTDNSLKIESSRPGQDTTIEIKDIDVKDDLEKDKKIRAGDELGKAKKDGDDYSFNISVKDDGNEISGEDWMAGAADSSGDNSTTTDSDGAQRPIGEEGPGGATGAEDPSNNLNSDQVSIVKTIIGVGEQMKSKGITTTDIQVAVATAETETGWQNYGNYGGKSHDGNAPTDGVYSPMKGSGSEISGGSKELAKSMDDPRITTKTDSDGNSLGTFQQQATLKSDGTQETDKDKTVWGKWESILNTVYSAQKFYETMLEKNPDASSRNAKSFGEQSHAVQGSAYPDKANQTEAKAKTLYDKYKGAGKDPNIKVFSDIKDAGVNLNSASSRGKVSGDSECAGSTSSSGERGGGMGARAGTLAANVIKYADSQTGLPYSQAAGERATLVETKPKYHDCSSFVSWAYWYGAGIWMSADAGGWTFATPAFDAKYGSMDDVKIYEGPSSGISESKLKAGDIINMDGHVYLYAGNDTEYAAHTYGQDSSKSSPWTTDAIEQPIRVYRPLNAKSPKEVQGSEPPKDVPSDIMKMWEKNKKW